MLRSEICVCCISIKVSVGPLKNRHALRHRPSNCPKCSYFKISSRDTIELLITLRLHRKHLKLRKKQWRRSSKHRRHKHEKTKISELPMTGIELVRQSWSFIYSTNSDIFTNHMTFPPLGLRMLDRPKHKHLCDSLIWSYFS